MKEPLVIIHGVANHEEPPFLQTVDELQNKLGQSCVIIPVFWGDLGGKSNDISDCLPKFQQGEWQVRSLAAMQAQTPMAQQLVRSELGGQKSNEERIRIIIFSTSPSGEAVRSNGRLEQIIAEELEKTSTLKFIDDEKILKALGEAVRGILDAAQEPQGEFAVRAWGIGEITDTVKAAISKVIQGVDTSIGQVVENTLGLGNQQLRDWVMPMFALFFGDIFTYQRNQIAVQSRIWAAIKKAADAGTIEQEYGTQTKPIHLAAHSLGGVVAFDAAVLPPDDKKLWLKSFTTFGSQAAFFQILDARRSIGIYSEGQPIRLPLSIAKWINLWHPMDLLGFTAGTVFRLHDGTQPRDIPVSEPASHLFGEKLWAHSIYWHSDELVDVLKAVLNLKGDG